MGPARIPLPVIAVVGDVLGTTYYHHQTLETLFIEHGAPGDPPPGNCVPKCTEWLKRCNDDPNVDPFAVMGGVLQELMETRASEKDRERVRKILSRSGLSYHQDGKIVGGTARAPTRGLKEILEERDLQGVEVEVRRALDTVESDPPSGLTAACSLIESLCKSYITAEALPMPNKQTIKPLWKVVSERLELAPGRLVQQDLRRILSGLHSVIDGLGSLRTHAGSAHGQGPGFSGVEARHARLAIHAAHSLAVFVLETWDEKRKTS